MKLLYNKIFILLYKIYFLIFYIKKYFPQFYFKRILEKNFFRGEKFSFLLVGANDGISHDFLFEFLRERKVAGIAVEPLKDIFKKLKVNFDFFPNVQLVNKAVHPFSKEVIIFRVDPAKKELVPDWAEGIGSLIPDHHEKSAIPKEYIIKEKVEADSFMNIVENFNCYSLDLLQIDVEGFDFEILKMVDFNVVKPKIIKYEFCNLSEQDRKAAKTKLKEVGYFLFTEGNDMIAVDIRKVRL